jgi:hypothetical protein
MQNEYQLRLKDLNMNERIKELTRKFTTEAEEARARHELLAQEKADQEAEYEEKMKQLEERNAQQMCAIENQYQQKLMGEVERYQQLAQVGRFLNQSGCLPTTLGLSLTRIRKCSESRVGFKGDSTSTRMMVQRLTL